MTNEEIEIIKIVFQSYLNIVRIFGGADCISEKVVTEVRDKLIKELEQQPCEDCVKREDVKSGMIKYGFLALDMTVTEFVEDIPPVQPQPKRGHWIEVEVHNCYATLKCSECDRVIEPTYTFGEYSYEDIKEFYPYCHCGARMNADMREVKDE